MFLLAIFPERDGTQGSCRRNERMVFIFNSQAKAKREEDDTKRQMEGNLETLAVLQKQMAALAAQREEEKTLIEEEAQLLVRE